MFKSITRKFKTAFSGVTENALAASDEKVMEAMIAAMVRVCYADGICQNEEVDKVNEMIKSNPQLVEFYNEPARLFDAYCDQMEASSIMAKMDLNKKIEQIAGDSVNAPRVLISAIEVAFAHAPENTEELRISPEEEQVLVEISKMLDLKLGKYL